MRTTIKEIAKLCGVSPTTVSLVLNQREARISSETRDNIMNVAKKMHYRPNRLAVGLIKKETKALGLIVPEVNDLYYSGICRGCENMSRAKGYTLSIACNNDCTDYDFRYLDMFAGNNVDGIIYVASSTAHRDLIHEECQSIVNLGLPVVAVGCSLDIPGIRYIQVNHHAGSVLATKYLLNLGHKKIGFLTGPLTNDVSSELLSGYQDALAMYGLPFEERYVYSGMLGVEDGIRAYRQLSQQDITAVFCSADLPALGFNKMMRSENSREYAIIGYGDSAFNDLVYKPLTSIRQPTFMIGQCAINLLLDMIHENTSISDVSMTPTIHIRNSTFELK